MKKNKAFTLIELVSVLVILVILALIVTPLVLNIIRKARTAADKRSIDAYGRSIELAIADYLLDNGTFPTSIEELTIEYSGDRVVCSTTRLNSDSSIYLSECTVNSRAVTGYTYGKSETQESDEPATSIPKSYNVGDTVEYNEINYYVIKNSDTTEDTVKLLKAEPLTVAEVNQYGVGYINKNTETSQNTARDMNGYGSVAYYSSETCGYINNNWVTSGCTALYEQSDIKHIVDAWAHDKVNEDSIIEARLLLYNELFEDLGMEFDQLNPTTFRVRETENTPNWIFGDNYSYWMMTPLTDSNVSVRKVDQSNIIAAGKVYSPTGGYYAIRPVIIVKKSALN